MSDVKEFWETCKESFAHLDQLRDEIHQKKGKLLQSLQPIFKLVDFKDKVVLDYGIGKGDFGKYLYDHKHIKKYVAMDIAKRSLDACEKTLENYPSFEGEFAHHDFLSTKSMCGVDIFTTFACIQHFPNLEYAESFLNGLNDSNIEYLILQPRSSKIVPYESNEGPYTSQTIVARRFSMQSSFIESYLSNYSLIYESEVAMTSHYQYLAFQRNN